LLGVDPLRVVALFNARPHPLANRLIFFPAVLAQKLQIARPQTGCSLSGGAL
jgi:hypothetical protein